VQQQGRQERHDAAGAAHSEAIDLPIGDRLEGPIFLGSDGTRLDRHAAGRLVRRVARRAGTNKKGRPHTLRQEFITAAP